MSFARSLGKAFQRSVESIRDETAKAMRMEVNPTSRSEGALSMWGIRSRPDLSNFAIGSDKDIGGLSVCELGLDEEQKHGRFRGTVTSDLPRNSRIERSGYAAFRNKSRPTLFGQQTWDTTVHPFLALRVRNRFAEAVNSPLIAEPKSREGGIGSTVSSPSLRQALHSTSIGRSPTEVRAIHALGIGLREPPGPKFFINIQTDGPVTSDLFQHRLYFDERQGSEWQTIVVPFDDFVLTNTGQVAASQIHMMRERIRTVGLSVVLESPSFPLSPRSTSTSGKQEQAGSSPPSALRKRDEQEEDDWAKDGSLRADRDSAEALPPNRGSKRGSTWNFDLGIDEVFAIGSVEEIRSERSL